MATFTYYSKTGIDAKMHMLTASEISAETSRIKVADNATGYALYQVSFTEATLGKVFQFTFTPASPTTVPYVTVYYDGDHAVHMTASGNNYYFTIYDIAAGQDLAAITVTGLMGCRIVSI